MSATKKSGDRVTELDALRGLAALVVLVSHYSVYCREHYQRAYLPFRLEGHWAVLLFFIISGFVITMTLERCRTALDFVVSRVARLYPPYWGAVIVTFAIVWYFGLPNLPMETVREVSLTSALANLTMFHAWFEIPSVDGVYWTLFAEMSFYGWILLAFSCGLLPKIRWIAIGCLVLQAGYLWLERHGRVHLPEIWRLTFLVEFANFFIAGIMFYRIAKKQHSWLEHAIVAACCITFYTQATNKLDVIVSVLIFATFYAAIYGKLRWIVNPVTIFFGSISYTLYLVHQHAGYVGIRELHGRGVPIIAAQLVTAALAILIATLLSALIERPAQRWVKDHYKRWKAARASVPVVSAAGANEPAVSTSPQSA